MGALSFEPLPPGQVDPDCPGSRHGAHDSAYTHFGCRCAPARAAYARYRKHLAAGLRGDQRRIHATGTRRRLRGLAAVGHSLLAIARDCAVDEETLRLIRIGESRQVTPRVADAVRAGYDRLWSIPGPSTRSIELARRNGWPPPMWWDDDHIEDPRARSPRLRRNQEEPRAG